MTSILFSEIRYLTISTLLYLHARCKSVYLIIMIKNIKNIFIIVKISTLNNKKFEIVFDVISNTFNEIRYLTRSLLHDSHAECKIV